MDDETPLTMELAQVSNSWRKLYKSSKKYLRVNLHPGEAQYSYDPNTGHLKYVNIRKPDLFVCKI